MTAARIRGSKRVMSNSETDLDRLEGLSALVEDWHAKVIFLEVRQYLVYLTVLPLFNSLNLIVNPVIFCLSCR